MRIYEIKQNETDRNILANMLYLLTMPDIRLNECMMYQYSKPVHTADRKYFQISNTISANFKLIGLPAYHKHGPIKICKVAIYAMTTPKGPYGNPIRYEIVVHIVPKILHRNHLSDLPKEM